MNYTVLTYPNPLLSQRAQEISSVNDEIRRLTAEMFEIMYRDRGVGLAAPQIGVSKRIFVANPKGEKGEPEFIFINPVLSNFHEEYWGPEGCLSLPGLSADVPRARHVTVEAFDEEGKRFRLNASDFLARVIQHENDHLDGKLFIDRISYGEREKLLANYSPDADVTEKAATDERRFFRFL